MLDGCYPVAMEYLYCVIIMCLINLKQQDEARKILIKAWNMAKPDGFLEPFIEHHGLMLDRSKPVSNQQNRKITNGFPRQLLLSAAAGWLFIIHSSRPLLQIN